MWPWTSVSPLCTSVSVKRRAGWCDLADLFFWSSVMVSLCPSLMLSMLRRHWFGLESKCTTTTARSSTIYADHFVTEDSGPTVRGLCFFVLTPNWPRRSNLVSSQQSRGCWENFAPSPHKCWQCLWNTLWHKFQVFSCSFMEEIFTALSFPPTSLLFFLRQRFPKWQDNLALKPTDQAALPKWFIQSWRSSSRWMNSFCVSFFSLCNLQIWTEVVRIRARDVRSQGISQNQEGKKSGWFLSSFLLAFSTSLLFLWLCEFIHLYLVSFPKHFVVSMLSFLLGEILSPSQ